MPSPKTLESRARKLIRELADGVPMNEATDLMVKINAITLKLSRMEGCEALADSLGALKRAANSDGRQAYLASLQRDVQAAREREREEKRTAPDAWMRSTLALPSRR